MAMVLEANKILNGITDKDLELIKQLCLPYKIICQNMELNQGTVRLRVKRLISKMGVESRTALVVKAIKLGLVSIDELPMREYAKDISGKIN